MSLAVSIKISYVLLSVKYFFPASSTSDTSNEYGVTIYLHDTCYVSLPSVTVIVSEAFVLRLIFV
nr:MAG TPA: hypothetical protein [Caudoviricetes sp.]